MMEKIITFGSAEQVGILSLPDDDSFSARPAVLMWNVGMNHRVGPFRIYVDLGRKLAAEGFAAFRFDVSGLGDSGVRREAVTEREREERDVSDAIDAVARRTGIETFVLVGFCSSVDVAHRVAVKDPRVTSVIYIEGYAFETRGSRVRRTLRWLSLRRWQRRAWRTFPRLFPSLGGALDVQAESIYKRDYPAWSQFSSDLVVLTQRGTSLLFIYAGGDTLFNYEGQFYEMFGAPGIDRRRVELVYYADADHTFFDVRIRESVVACAIGFVERLPTRSKSTPCASQRMLGKDSSSAVK